MTTKNTADQLPKGIKASDLKRPKDYNKLLRDASYGAVTFNLWYTKSFGWVIPTLKIAGARGGFAQRTYAIAVADKQMCRVGNGPHILRTEQVWVTIARQKDLQPFLDILAEGQEGAHMTRDRISTRRARTAQLRSVWGY